METHNAWITAVAPPAPSEPEQPLPAIPPPTGAAAPQAGVPAPDAADRLPRTQVPGPARLWVAGVHGGAGETTVAGLIPGARATGHAWPVTAEGEGAAPGRVLLVCRSNAHGLKAAQRALIEWSSGHAPDIDLLGLAVLADAPGRLPKPLRTLTTVVGGGAPRLWHLPWVEAWRTADTSPGPLPQGIRHFTEQLASLLPAGGTE